VLVGLSMLACFHVDIRLETYKWQTAVRALANLGLVKIDENLGMTKGPAAAVARHAARMYPAHGLFVDELDGGVGTRLYLRLANAPSSVHTQNIPDPQQYSVQTSVHS
jgi:hypothetical protein